MCARAQSSTEVIQKYLDPGIKMNNLCLRSKTLFADTCNYGTALLGLKFNSHFLDRARFK